MNKIAIAIGLCFALAGCSGGSHDGSSESPRTNEGDRTMKLAAELLSKEKEKRERAAKEVVSLCDSDEAASSLRPLLELMLDHEDEAIWFPATICVGRRGKWSIPLLQPRLESDKARIRRVALSAIAWMEPRPSELIPIVLHLCDDDDEDVRFQATRVLRSVERVDSAVVRKLLEMTSRPSAQDRSAGLSALKQLANDIGSTELLEKITRAANDGLRDESPMVREAAISMLANLDLNSDKLTEVLQLALKDPSPDVVIEASTQLKNLAPTMDLSYDKFSSSISAAYQTGSSEVRCAIAEAQAEMGIQALGDLTNQLESEADAQVIYQLSESIWNLSPETDAPIAAVIRLVRGQDPNRFELAANLAATFPESFSTRLDVFNALILADMSRGKNVRMKTIDVLEHMRFGKAQAELMLNKLAEADDRELELIAEFIVYVEPTRAFLNRIGGGESRNQTWLNIIKGRLHAGKPNRIKLIDDITNSPNASVRRQSAKTMVSLDDQKARSSIQAMLDDPDPVNRELAARILQSLDD